jgi:thymidylate kinase
MTKEKNKKGLFIVCEGLDGAGKTTTINEFLKRNNAESDYVYSKGLKSKTFIGRLAGKNPSTLTFFLELAYITHKIIKPNLKEGKIVLQDRYDISLASFVPSAAKWYNQLAATLIRPYLVKPDLLMYFTVQKEERISRLRKTADNSYHALLVNRPELIDLREKKYSEYFMNFGGEKARIDTSNRSIDSVVHEFEQIVNNFRLKNL